MTREIACKIEKNSPNVGHGVGVRHGRGIGREEALKWQHLGERDAKRNGDNLVQKNQFFFKKKSLKFIGIYIKKAILIPNDTHYV